MQGRVIMAPSRLCHRPKTTIKNLVIYLCITLVIFEGLKLSLNWTSKDDHIDKDLESWFFIKRPTDILGIITKDQLISNTSKINPTTKYHAHHKVNGYERADFLRDACSSVKEKAHVSTVRISYDPNHNVMYCPLCKLASTFWTRVFKMIEMNSRGLQKKLSTPFDVPISKAPASKTRYNLVTGAITGYRGTRNPFKFLIVRNPYSLLYSAYVDKIVGPNPMYWKSFGHQGIKTARKNNSDVCGSDITFEEFLVHVVGVEKSKKPLDCHVAHFDACQPCRMNYTYVATMETFKEDTFHILKQLNQTKTIEIFETKFADLYAYDTIEDSTSGPFLWKREIIKCIPWHEALKRIWKKLQMRGVIANTEQFPLTEKESLTLSRQEYIQILWAARNRSMSADISKQKQTEYLKLYSNVPIKVLDSIRQVYQRDFKLFGYDDSPKELFERQISSQQPLNTDCLNMKLNLNV